ncbi:MAG: prephenate dehydrogenase [Proteobacteria bacterium]|nr:prephenate dehydrogenase [Pseudomonadota bacterium]
MIIAMLGYGRFGRAFAERLQQVGHKVRAFDPQTKPPGSMATASAAAAIDGAQWVVLAMPVPAMADALADIRTLLDPEQTVIDVGSVKQQPCALMGKVLGRVIPHLGTHPLFGPLSIARGDALRVVLCPSDRHPEATERARALFGSIGCTAVVADAAAHDRAMAKTHALAFFIARAMVEMGIGDDLSMAPPSFQGLAGMIAAVRGDAGHLFAAIQRENPYSEAARKELIEHLQRIDQRLREGDEAMPIPPPAAKK